MKTHQKRTNILIIIFWSLIITLISIVYYYDKAYKKDRDTKHILTPSIDNTIKTSHKTHTQKGEKHHQTIGIYSKEKKYNTQIDNFLGNGFFLDDTYILTNKHIFNTIQSNKRYIIYTPTSQKDIQNIWLHPSYDLAILRIAKTKNANKTIGSPISAGSGLLSTKYTIKIHDKISIQSFDPLTKTIHEKTGHITTITDTYYQSTIPGKPGESGSPVYNIHGKIIGIASAINKKEANSLYVLPLTSELLTFEMFKAFSE